MICRGKGGKRKPHYSVRLTDGQDEGGAIGSGWYPTTPTCADTDADGIGTGALDVIGCWSFPEFNLHSCTHAELTLHSQNRVTPGTFTLYAEAGPAWSNTHLPILNTTAVAATIPGVVMAATGADMVLDVTTMVQQCILAGITSRLNFWAIAAGVNAGIQFGRANISTGAKLEAS